MIPVKMISFPQVGSFLLGQTLWLGRLHCLILWTKVAHISKNLTLLGVHLPENTAQLFPVVVPNLSVLPSVLVPFQTSRLHTSQTPHHTTSAWLLSAVALLLLLRQLGDKLHLSRFSFDLGWETCYSGALTKPSLICVL